MKQTVLIIAAHPDDEILGAGGAIARHSEEGDEVHTLILGRGIASREGLSESQIQADTDKLMQDVAQAHAVLGNAMPTVEDLPDQRFDTVALLEITQIIERTIKDVLPTLVYTHWSGDVNEDHRCVARATEAAVRPLQGGSIQEVRSFEIASSTEWNYVRPAFHPHVFVGLSEQQLDKKLNAMRAYKGEIRDFPHPRSIRYLESLARVRGAQSGSPAAEGFELIYRRI